MSNNNGLRNKLLTRLFWSALLLFLWEVTAISGVFPAAIFPSLAVIGKALAASVANGEIIAQTAYSLILILQGLALGFLGAVILSSFAIVNTVFKGLTETLTALAHPLPGIALLPLIIIWFGTGTRSIIAIIVHSVIWPLIINMMAGFTSIPLIYKEAGQNMGLKPSGLITKIMIPASLPYLLSGMRIAWARSWRALISAEMIFGAVGSQGGLGWYIFKQRVFMDTPGMFAGIMVIIAIGILIEDIVFSAIENRTVKKWGMI